MLVDELHVLHGGKLLCLRDGPLWGSYGWTERKSMPKNKDEFLQLKGKVVQALANTQFRVELETGQQILAHVSGRMRKHFIRIVPGDEVIVEISPYDLTKGRIIYRTR